MTEKDPNGLLSIPMESWFMAKVEKDIKHNKKMKWIRMSFEEDSIHGL